MNIKIYLARPITGLGYDEVVGYYDRLKNELEGYGYDVFQPMTAKGYLRNEREFKSTGYDGVHQPVSTNHAIFERDMWMIRTADMIYCNLMGAKSVSIGCVSEMAAGAVLGKHVIVAMEPENIHRHAFILEAADAVFAAHEDAMQYLLKLSNQDA